MKQFLLFLCLLAIGQAQAQTQLRLPWRSITGLPGSATTTTPSTNTNIVTVVVTYASAPTNATATFATLKYDKLASFQLDFDDQLKVAADGPYAYYSGTSTVINSVTYTYPNAKTFTDGAGNAVRWTAGIAVNAKNNFDDANLWVGPTRYTATEIAAMINNGWTVLNHGYYHNPTGNFVAPTGSTFSSAGWNLANNESYTFGLLQAAGVTFRMRAVVIPSAHAGFVRAGDSLTYLGATGTGSVTDGYTKYSTNTALNLTNAGGNFINEELLPANGSLFNNPGYALYTRNFSDVYADANVATLKAQIDDLLLNAGPSKHLSMRLGTHNSQWDAMKKVLDHLDSVALDRVWITSFHEYLEYRETKRKTTVSKSQSGNTVTFTLDMSAIPSINRYRDISLIVSGGTISNVTVQGADTYSVNVSTGLINVFKKKLAHVAPSFAPISLAISGVDSVAEGSARTYQVLATYPSAINNVTSSATFSASRGTVSGLTITKGNSLTVANAENSLYGDDRITRLTASYLGVSASREIVLKDSTTSWGNFSPKFADAGDIANYPQIRLGDYIIRGANKVTQSQKEYSIQVRKSYQNRPTLAPGSTIWIQGGNYSDIVLELNLSRNDNTNPIKVSNLEGQVRVRNSMVILGAQGVKFTGQYVAGVSGDADYTGHRNGYSFTSGRYGFLFDNQWVDPNRAAIRADSGSFNLEFQDIEFTGGYFTAALLNDNNYEPGTTVHTPYRGIKWHDTYIHDLDGEGLYIGSTAGTPKAIIQDVEVYNNRILRVGNEVTQIGQIRKGVRFYNNVGHGAMRVKGPFEKFQDNDLQFSTYGGDIKAENNLLVNYGEKAFQILTKADSIGYSTSVADSVIIRNNAFLYGTGGWGGYAITQEVSSVKSPILNFTLIVDKNLWGLGNYSYDQVYNTSTVPSAAMQNYVLKTELYGSGASITVRNNTYDGSPTKSTFINLNGTIGATQSGNNLAGSVPVPTFQNYIGMPGFDLTRLTAWGPSIAYGTRNDVTGMLVGNPITYAPGDLVMHKGRFYQSTATGNTAIEPGVTSGWQSFWSAVYWSRSTGLPVYNSTNLTGLSLIPADNTALLAGSAYQLRGMGNY